MREMKMRHVVWLGFAFGAFVAFAAGADISVEAPFDPKGGHVQGLCEGEGHYYLSQATRLFKLDHTGRCVKSVDVLSHTGDLCFHDGFVYASVAAYRGPHRGQGLIQVYDKELKLVREKVYPRGMDGIAYLNGKLYVGNGCHRETVPHEPGVEPQSKTPHLDNDMAIVDAETLELEKVVAYTHGHPTHYGAQNIATDGRLLYVTFYPAGKGGPDLVAYDTALKPVAQYCAKASNGLIPRGQADGLPAFLKCETLKAKDGVGAVLKPAIVRPLNNRTTKQSNNSPK